MKEFSNDELASLLINKVNQLKAEKAQSLELNEKLQESLAQLEETACQLEETQEKLRSERDNLKKEVKRKTDEVLKNEKLSAIGELAARIAHDMRNPLSVIKNTTEMIEENEKHFGLKNTEQWDRLNRAIFRISHQVDDVLDFVKLGHVTKKPTKLSIIFQDVIDRVVIPDNIKIKLPITNVTIPCDSDRLEVVFVNLIMNSVQAIGHKQGEIYIDVILEPDEVILITVKDNGPGIPISLNYFEI